MPQNSSECGFIARDITWPSNGDMNWTPISCNLTPLDYLLWGYAKDRVYADKPSTPEHFKTNIRQAIADIPSNMCQKVFENYLKKIRACNTSRGGSLNDVIFQI